MTTSIHRSMRGAWGKQAMWSEEGERVFHSFFFFWAFPWVFYYSIFVCFC